MLDSILKNFSLASEQKFIPPVAEPATEPVEQDLTQENECLTCGDTEWWQGFEGQEVKCWRCRPAPMIGLVKARWFYDEHGRKWVVKSDSEIEVCTLVD